MKRYRTRKRIYQRGAWYLALLLVMMTWFTACAKKQTTDDEYDRKEELRQNMQRWFDDSQAELDTQKNVPETALENTITPTQEIVGKPAIDRMRSISDEMQARTPQDPPHITEIPEKELLVVEFTT
ncbi:MAG: hypothetical protein K2O03_08140, partial [Lachnospiraceae bacterium]|nr:hypothetical protein [Lachnospiraceae bacterium]